MINKCEDYKLMQELRPKVVATALRTATIILIIWPHNSFFLNSVIITKDCKHYKITPYLEFVKINYAKVYVKQCEEFETC